MAFEFIYAKRGPEVTFDFFATSSGQKGKLQEEGMRQVGQYYMMTSRQHWHFIIYDKVTIWSLNKSSCTIFACVNIKYVKKKKNHFWPCEIFNRALFICASVARLCVTRTLFWREKTGSGSLVLTEKKLAGAFDARLHRRHSVSSVRTWCTVKKLNISVPRVVSLLHRCRHFRLWPRV